MGDMGDTFNTFKIDSKEKLRRFKEDNLNQFNQIIQGEMVQFRKHHDHHFTFKRGWDLIDVWPTTLKIKFRGRIKKFNTPKELADFLLHRKDNKKITMRDF